MFTGLLKKNVLIVTCGVIKNTIFFSRNNLLNHYSHSPTAHKQVRHTVQIQVSFQLWYLYMLIIKIVNFTLLS